MMIVKFSDKLYIKVRSTEMSLYLIYDYIFVYASAISGLMSSIS